jgi:hypothetical protein
MQLKSKANKYDIQKRQGRNSPVFNTEKFFLNELNNRTRKQKQIKSEEDHLLDFKTLIK